MSAVNRALAWIGAALVGLVLAGVVFYQASVWPRVWLIRAAWDDGTATAGQNSHLLRQPVRTITDLPYGPGAEERFDVLVPETPGPYPAVVWLHGGGFVGGVKEGVSDVLTVLASHGVTVLNVEYTKAPTAHNPHQVHQLAAAIDAATDRAGELGINLEDLVLGGDSAGAHMVAQAGLAAVDPGYAAGAEITQRLDPERIRGLVLASGPYDPGPALQSPGAFSWFLDSVLWAYLGERDVESVPRFAYSSIVDHASPALPPVFISSGYDDPLHPQSPRLATRLTALGVPATTSFHDGGHEFEVDLSTSPARANLAALVEFLGTL